jgi:hypothetical protein
VNIVSRMGVVILNIKVHWFHSQRKTTIARLSSQTLPIKVDKAATRKSARRKIWSRG